MVSKEIFDKSVQSIIASKKDTRKFYSADEFEVLKVKIRNRKEGLPFGDKNDYRKVSQFEIEELENVVQIKHKESGKFIVRTEDYYNILTKAHEETIHSGRDVMLKNLREKYFNIHQEIVAKYISLCNVCELKRNKSHLHDVVKPILTEEMNGRCQVDLIDYQSRPDGEYKFVLVYQDHLTKYVILRALKTKTMESIVSELFPIFIDFGAPVILHTDNGREFSNMLIEAFTKIWPNCKLVHGKPRHSQSQGSVERANQDIEKKIACWLSDNNSTNWSKGLPFVQYAKNRCFHRGIGCTPYEAMFGIKCRNNFENSTLPADLTSSIQSEEDLETILDTNSDDDSNMQTASPSTSGTLSTQTSAVEAFVGNRILANKLANFKIIRERCRKRQGKQASAMLGQAARKRHARISVGTSVRVPVPHIDRAKSDHRNILAVVLEQKERNLYVLGTTYGVLEGAYSMNQFEICNETFVDISEVSRTNIVTLREASGLASVGGASQGFIKCSCRTVCGSRCKCKSSNLLCHSRCHRNRSCNNYFN